MQPARYDGEGVTLNRVPGDPAELILLTGFFEDTNEVRLIRRDGAFVARWPVRFSELFPDTSYLQTPPETDWNADLSGAIALSDGSVIFTFAYAGLVKLDRCGNVVWTLQRPTHHSVERAEGGGFWVPSRRYHSADSPSPFPPFMTPYDEDTLLKVSDDGEILTEISVPGLFYESGLETLLTSNGEQFTSRRVWDKEIVHLNNIAVLTRDIAEDFRDFEAGDLALSLRKFNLLMVIDPETREIKWWQVGPWRRQHDPEFRPGGTIALFNNNVYRTAYGDGKDVSTPEMPRISNLMEVNPATGEHRILYGGRKGQELLSVIRGKIELTPRGGFLITEFEAGRVIETDAAGQIVWSFLNRYSADEVAEVTEARLYPESYFDVADWSCPEGQARSN